MKKIVLMVLIGVFCFNGLSYSEGIVKEPIRGAGPSTNIVDLFVKTFNDKFEEMGYRFGVPPKSTKHAGGIANSDEYIFGRTGRPLNGKESKLNKSEIFLARIPIAFATGNSTGVNSLSLEQIEGIFTGKIKSWSEVGGADEKIHVLGRESSEALFLELKKNYSFFEDSVFEDVYKKDHQIVNILQNNRGSYSIGFGAAPNFTGKNINVLEVKELSVGVNVGLVYDYRNENHPVVAAAKKFAQSKEWAEILTAETTSLPPL